MKKLFFGILSLLCCTACNNDGNPPKINIVKLTNDKSSSWYADNLRGGVKTLKTTTYEVEYWYGEAEKGKVTTSPNNHPLYFDPKTDAVGLFGSYNRRGYTNITRVFDDGFSPEIEPVGVFVNHYNRRGYNEYTEFLDNSFNLEAKTVNHWENDKLMGFKTCDANGVLVCEWNCKRNETSGDIIEENYSTKEHQYKTVYTPRQNDPKRSDVVIYVDDNPDQKGSVETEPNKRMIYNEKGRITGMLLYNESGKIISVMNDTYNYNKNGDISSINEKQYTFEYEYDQRGNWIKRTTCKGNDVLYIEEREIEYY